MAVRHRTGHELRSDGAVGTRLVFNHHGLTQQGCHFLGDDTGHRIVATTGCGRHHQGERFIGESVGHTHSGHHDQRGRFFEKL